MNDKEYENILQFLLINQSMITLICKKLGITKEEIFEARDAALDSYDQVYGKKDE